MADNQRMGRIMVAQADGCRRFRYEEEERGLAWHIKIFWPCYDDTGGPANCADGGRKGHSLLALADEGTYVLAASMAAKEQKYASMWVRLGIDGRIMSVVAIFICMCPLLLHLHRPTVPAPDGGVGRRTVADHQRTCSDLGMVI